MAEVDAKVNMSLDDIIKMEKKKKINPKMKRGGAMRGNTRGTMRGGARGTMRGGTRGNMRGNMRGNTRGNMRGNMRGRNQTFNKRGQWRRSYPQNNLQGGMVQKRFANGNIKSNLTRSRSNLSLNRMNLNNSPRGGRGGYASRRGGRFGLTRSRSRTNLSFTKPTFMAKNKGLKRTTSMPNLRDPSSVYNRLGYQSPAQVAYRNRVKRAKNVLIQRQNKAMRMQNAFSLSPTSNIKNLSSLDRKQTLAGRRYSAGSLRSDQLMRAQRRAQYEQKLMRISAARNNVPVNMSFLKNPYEHHPAMALYPTTIQTQNPLMMASRQLQMQRGRSPFRQSLQNLKAAAKAASRSASASRQQQRRAKSRSRSRSRARANSARNSIINLTNVSDLEDRSFSEVMYSLSNNFGVTRRTLNDRFSLF